jgi:hypothetical protein
VETPPVDRRAAITMVSSNVLTAGNIKFTLDISASRMPRRN